MIKINELRVGNWVEDESGFRQITMGMFAYEAEEGGDEFAVNPIPLSPEILEKAGFEMPSKVKELSNGFFITDYESNKEMCIQYEKEWGGEYVVDQLNLKHIKYLHQLQNFYFALTGKELEIKL